MKKIFYCTLLLFIVACSSQQKQPKETPAIKSSVGGSVFTEKVSD